MAEEIDLVALTLNISYIFLLISLIFIIWGLGFTEFSYLGTGGIKWLYDLFNSVYESKWKKKEYSSPEIQEKLFVKPLRDSLGRSEEACFLDLACGSGRLSLMVLSQPWFLGKIEAIDFSQGMLKTFKQKLQDLPPAQQERVQMNCLDLCDWKPENQEKYDAISLMEAGEFLPNFPELVIGIGKILKPNGLFLLTKPPDWMSWAYPGRKQNTEELISLLKKSGFTDIQIFPWSSRYEVVQAWKEI